MSNDDPTKKLPDSEPPMDTQPTIETLLTRLADFRSEVLGAISEMRAEMERGFHNVERRLDVVSADINQMRADLRYLEDRVDKLEHKPS